MTIQVAIVDDQDIIRLGVRQSLADFPTTFLGGYPDVLVLPLFGGSYADVVLLMTLPDTDVVRAYRPSRNGAHALPCWSSVLRCPRTTFTAIRREPWGRKTNRHMLVVGIQHAHARKVYLSPHAALIAGCLDSSPVLSPRLEQVLHLMARGHHVQSIARELGITDRAVYNARKRLREILDVETNEQIVAEAMRRGLLRGEG